VKIGTWVPCYRSWVRGDQVLRLATSAEDMAFDSLWVQDHLVAPVGGLEDTRVEPVRQWLDAEEYGNQEFTAVEYYGEENWWLDPYMLWGFLAGRTTNIQLGSCIIVLPYRDPIVQAKMLGTLDVLSNGRMLFGIGVGHVDAEFRAIGVPFAKRGARADEYVRLIRQMLQGEEFDFEGQFIHLPKVRPLIKSMQQPCPPVLIGGNSQRAVRRAVELGDVWLPANLQPEKLRIGQRYMETHAAERGSPCPGTAVALNWGLSDPKAPYSGKSLRKFLSVGRAAELLNEYAELGVQHLTIDLPNPNERILVRQMELLTEAVAESGVREKSERRIDDN
jgi:probable F420-dependent oxidoreductase